MRKWFITSMSFLSSFAWTTIVHAQITIEETGLYQTAKDVYGDQKDIDLGTYLATSVVKPLFAISGVIFLVLMLYAGILWMTDQGELDQVKKAKNILKHSTIGLIILMMSYAITNLVLNIASGENLNNT